MHDGLPLLALLAMVGSGLISGLLFAFSNFVMQALRELPDAYGQQAMQRINVRIINPVFLTVFMGSTLACVAIAIICVLLWPFPGAAWLFAGASVYLVGPFGITVAFNVPLNNALAEARPEQAGIAWPVYARRWLRWNHARSILAVAATALLGYGLYRLDALPA